MAVMESTARYTGIMVSLVNECTTERRARVNTEEDTGTSYTLLVGM